MLHSITPTKDTATSAEGRDGSARRSVCSEYLLVCEAQSTTLTDGHWHFSIEAADGSPVFDAGDDEIGDLNRLTLLAAVRGLEAIDGPASVTLLSNNRYLIRSLSDSLPRWRKSDFAWEHFGRRIDVQHADLWRRVDRALSIHRVEACLISSRLVSSGNGAAASAASPSALPAQQRPSPVLQRQDGVQQRRDGAQHLRIDAPHGQPVPSARASRQPSDRLRRWLLETGSSANSDSRRRFTAADLLETT